MKNRIFFFFLCCVFQSLRTEAQPLVTFRLAPDSSLKSKAAQVYLAGDFNNWNPAETAWQIRVEASGQMMLSRRMPRGLYAYKLTRGSWATVECNAGGGTIDNRYLKVLHDTSITLQPAAWQDHFKQQPKQHTATAQVSIISEAFDMPQLGRKRRVWIYLPPDYGRNHRRYPVLYMHDGQNLFDSYTSGYGEWDVDELMASLPDAQQSIIVGIDHGGEYRIAEYDPYDSKYGKGRGDDYVRFLVQILKPYIDTHYRTLKDVRHTTVAGSSMGGLISLYATLTYPNVFGNAGVFSPALWIAPQLFTYASQHPVNRDSGFYLVCGDAESDSMVPDMQKMVNLLQQKLPSGTRIPSIVVKGAHHNEQQWHDDFPAFYRWLLSRY